MRINEKPITRIGSSHNRRLHHKLRVTVAFPAKNKKSSANFPSNSHFPLRRTAKNLAIRATPPGSIEASILCAARSRPLGFEGIRRSVNRRENRNRLSTRP